MKMNLDAFIAEFRRFRQKVTEEIGDMDDMTMLEFYRTFKRYQSRKQTMNSFMDYFLNLSSLVPENNTNPDSDDNDDDPFTGSVGFQ